MELDLSDLNLTLLHVTPDEDAETIDFVLAGSVRGIDAETLEQVEGARLHPEKLICRAE